MSKRLLHRWLVEYNPIYLLSASLCLAGIFLISRSLAHESSGILAVAGIAEAYGIALVLGAALLTRLGQRRPGVVLGLLAVVFQGDLTLHTEACAFLGGVGQLASLAWVVLFVGKLFALSWALRLRVSKGAWGLAAAGAAGLALIPHLFDMVSPRGATALVAAFVGALATAGIYGSRAITSVVPLDDWGELVLRRATRAAWAIWSVLLALHILFWSTRVALNAPILVAIVVMASTRYLRREAYVWAGVAACVEAVGLFAPSQLAIVSAMASVTLLARAQLHRQRELVAEDPRAVGPYRVGPAAPDPFVSALVRPALAARKRLLTGALFAAYIAVWTMDWSGGSWAAHVIALDIALTLLVAIGVWRLKIRISLIPLAAVYTHYAVQTSLLTAPQTALAWGTLSVSVGFLLLLVALAASYWLRHVEDAEKPLR